MRNIYSILSVRIIYILLVSFPFTIFCQSLDWDYGRNDYEIPLENVDRHFIVHVPQSYTGNEAVPIVFMFHGTSAQGHGFWVDSCSRPATKSSGGPPIGQ